jgi:hypothetical protein
MKVQINHPAKPDRQPEPADPAPTLPRPRIATRLTRPSDHPANPPQRPPG